MWTSNPNQFVEDEDDDTFSFSVRIAAQDVLLVSTKNVQFSSCQVKIKAIPIMAPVSPNKTVYRSVARTQNKMRQVSSAEGASF